ncbi:hypothetical protein EDD36DRAFT_467616 [Exophiala viscosa]|uniref:Transcription factor Iwr1 domain-containing protein n=1 Tax=Exophiala viscosa TaxID=2486360 RepID=A0AAN6DQ69_9EURO|nr:hypothetical protein EDD36DRAFT_467616 [Exophiala viscosa]
MSSVPERISIKRKRNDLPPETLYLEHGSAVVKKRRVTDFYFQRVRDRTIAPISLREKTEPPPKASPRVIPGVPTVRWTSPGDEKRDYEKLKASLKAQANTDTAGTNARHSQDAATGSQSAPATPISTESLQAARRFHLARNLSSVLSPNSSGGIRKQKSGIRPPLATFVEKHGATFSHENNPLYRGEPVDKILDTSKVGNLKNGVSEGVQDPDLETLRTSHRNATNTFLQATAKGAKKGTSIMDHPSTWDQESDQLADELAALAMELDPEVEHKVEEQGPPTPLKNTTDTVMTSSDREDEYIYETYIRVPYDDKTQHTLDLSPNNIGVLVITEEDEDLWLKYVDSDDDSDWDDEDSNAEDNPANDYPEDEVSSDDEYGYNAYKYRHQASDDEAFDEDEDADGTSKW